MIRLTPTAFETALAAIEAAHARELATLREQIAGAEQARIAMQALVEQFAGQLHDADEVMKAERARSDALLADLHRDLDAAKRARRPRRGRHCRGEGQGRRSPRPARSRTAARPRKPHRPPRSSGRQRPPEGEGPPTPRLGRLAGAIALPAADDLRRVVRRAVWQPRAVLRGLWARLRAAWREWSE